MKWYRIELKNKEIGYIKDKKLLVSNNPKVIWNEWYGCDTVDVYEVEGEVIKNRVEKYETEEGEVIEIEAPIIRVSRVEKVDEWTY